MSEWNDNALVSQKLRLMTNVKLAPQLQHMLEWPAGGFMTREEAQSVENRMSDDQQMAQVIQILRGKVFCKLLRESNYGVWADELQKAAGDFRLKGHHFNCSHI